MTSQTRQPARRPSKLDLLGGFSLVVNGLSVTLPIHAQRVLAYLSLVQPVQSPHLRAGLAERLWYEVTTERSHASLRTALWRIRQADPSLVQASRETLRLADAVDVDVRRGIAQAARLLGAEVELRPQDTELGALLGDLLPGWDEDWLLLERERIRQVQVHALEALTDRLRRLGRYAEAIEAAYAAISHEPLRESAHIALIDVFLDEGNAVQAHNQLTRYAAMLWSELGVEPSAELVNRVVPATRGHGAPVAGPGRARPVWGAVPGRVTAAGAVALPTAPATRR
jgi:DNA-binding SARP family transcriptional activator